MDAFPSSATGPEHPLLETLLWSNASATAFVLGYVFTSDCEEHVRDFIRDGLAKMASEGLTSDPGSLLKARAHLSKFVAQMVIQAQEMGFTELHEPTFFSAKPVLCPLWPFC